MCGIAGAFSREPTEDCVSRMTQALAHRGPDDLGYHKLATRSGDEAGTFGHRRLSILDLSMAGHQPMSTADGRFTLTYNGEIFNFAELKSELEGAGYRFTGHCDTEVLLAGWATYGASILPRLRGMFAFAIWDSANGKCHLARDRFGIKPLYLSAIGSDFLFASEVRALLASDRIPRHVCTEAVRSYLLTGSVAEPLTIISGITALAPGVVLTLDLSGGGTVSKTTEVRYAREALASEPGTAGLEEASSALRETLRDSLRCHLRSDVPVGVFLSGGIDSSALVAVSSEVSEAKIRTFNVNFRERGFGEGEAARRVAERFHTEHEEILLSGRDLLTALPDVFAAMDQPTQDGVNTFVVSRAVKSFGIKVVLSGLGGDELFAGYPSFRRARMMERAWKLPSVLRTFAAAGAAHLPTWKAKKLEAMLAGDSPALGAYAGSRMILGPGQIAALFPHGESPAARPDGTLDELSLLQQVSQHEMSGYMRNTLLRDSDTFSMANSLELRVPLVDKQVVAAAMSVRDDVKLASGSSKPVLFAAVRDLLPPEIGTLPKKGFTLPFSEWLHVELRGEIERVFESGQPADIGLDASEARRAWAGFQRDRGAGARGHVNASAIWSLYTLIRWAKLNDVVFAG